MEGDEHSIKKEPEVQWGMKSLYDVCRELWNQSEIYIMHSQIRIIIFHSQILPKTYFDLL